MSAHGGPGRDGAEIDAFVGLTVRTLAIEGGAHDDDTAAALREQIAEFKKGFQTSEGKLLAGREEHVALEEEDVTQEQIVRQKRG